MMKEKGLTLIPYGGLTNRMRALGALISMMRDNPIRGEAIWFKDKGLNCRFDALFEPLQVERLRLKEARLSDYIFRDRPRKKNLFIPALLQHILYDDAIHEAEVDRKFRHGFDFKQWAMSHRRVYISSCMPFYRKDNENLFSSFVPIRALREKIEQWSEKFSENTVGVHIRRTDNVLTINESPSSLYIAQMKEEVARNSQTTFYVASDSPAEKRVLSDLFGERVIALDAPVARDTLSGMQDALVELYLLSRTTKILGSRFSMYAITAAEIGGIEHIDLNVNR